jgi:IclR family transcriptional regulator, acetate operon repressor
MAADGQRERNLLQRATQLISLMVDNPADDWGVRELARVCDSAPSTVYRALRAMTEQGLLQADSETGRYRLGMEFLRLALRATAKSPIRSIALPYMQELVHDCRETAVLALYDSLQMDWMIAAVVESPLPLRYVLEVGKRFPIHAGAAGQAIMAFLQPEERTEVYAKVGLPAVTDKTITDPVVLERELDQVRGRGYALAKSQRLRGCVGIAAPIWGLDGKVLGSLGVTCPEQRFDPHAEVELTRLVEHQADNIASQIGGKRPAQQSPGTDGS